MSNMDPLEQKNDQTSKDGLELDKETRLRTLTEKAQIEYDQTVTNYFSKLSTLKRNVDYEIGTYKSEDQTKESISVCQKRIENSLDKYLNMAEEISQYLKRKNTADSLRELENHESVYTNVELSADEVFRDMQRIQQRTKTKSVKSVRSNGRSSVASSTTKMKARAEAAKASLEFAAKEAELKKADAEIQRKQMDIQADLEFLSKQKEAAVAYAEYKAAMEDDDSQHDAKSLQGIPKQDELDRTRQYVESHRNVTFNSQNFRDNPVHSNTHLGDHTSAPFIPSTHQDQMPVSEPVETHDTNNPSLSEFSRFLLKKDLLMSRFNRFNDRPESYALWKSGFKAITKELEVTAVEESELLIKWLGPDSSKFGQSIRTSNLSDPSIGLRKIWQRLEERFGSPEMIETSLKTKINEFPKVTFRDVKRLYDLQDVLSEILSIKENPVYEKLLSYFDSSVGINPIMSKLPQSLQYKWRDKATNYKKSKNVPYPPFSFFVEFISDQASKYNDPGFKFESDQNNNSPQARDKESGRSSQRPRLSARNINVSKTEIATSTEGIKPIKLKCAIHKTNHSLNDCRSFLSKSIEDRRKIIKENGICFKCINSKDHLSRNCPENVQCKECDSSTHSSGMHIYGQQKMQPLEPHGGEQSEDASKVVKACCMDICNGKFSGKSCAKILPVFVSHEDNPSKRIKTYIILDEQSNRSLGRKELFDSFDIVCKPEEYTLMSCSGRTRMNGRRVSGLLLESLDGSTKMQLPTVIECKEISNNRDEIPTPDVANYHDHLRSISHELEPLDENADILLLIGRDLLEAHHIIEQRIGPAHSPYAQRLALGWVIIGDVCIGNRHVTDSVKSYKTYVQAGGRPSLLKPCPNVISVRELLKTQNKLDNIDFDETNLGDGVFDRTEFDDTPGKSIEDKIFLDIMEKDFHKNEHGNWCAPLPFKPNRERLPNNFPMALRRAKTLDRSLQSNKEKREHFLEFMHNLIQNNHAEIAPKLDEGAESWYLPVFGIYHPKKPGKIRCVFDSSAKFGDVSLNKVLLQGPDLNNSLLSVLMRFRKNRIAASADVQQMFYSFSVDEKHRDFLRFLWHEDNDLDKQLVAFRMTVHVFGNSPSPAVATYGLRKCSNLAEPDVRDFIQRHFYVDDGLISLDSSQDMIDLLTRTQKTLLEEGNIRLHKFASNSDEVMSALPHEDLAQDLKSIDFDSDSVPLQRSLGLYWDLATDCFTYRISEESKPFTRRGVLSTLNSLFDPLGFVAPVIIKGKIILRELMAQSVDWDEPLPEHSRSEWETWRNSLSALQNITIPRMYVSSSLSKKPTFELHVFADASEKAIAAVSYLRTIKPDGNFETGFILGKAKVAPHHGHTIPRLELCAAVLAVDVAKTVVENFDETFDVVKFYTDSKVVLGYIFNQTRRFYVYVEHRIERIRKSTVPEQWNYVPTSVNPADQATRSVSSEDIGSSCWLQGPTKFLSGELQASASTETLTTLVNPDLDKEVRPIVTVTKTTIEDSHSIGSERFQNFSSWKSLVNGIAVLQRFIQSRFKKFTLQDIDVVKSLNESEIFIIKTIQSEVYSSEIDCIVNGQNLRKNSSIISLDPFLDSEGILRVGGRLNKSNLPYQERNPLILPGKCHVSKLLVQHFHAQVKHQGRHFTEGAIRAEGYWITGSKRLVSSVIHHCVPCRKLRGCLEVQKMADLPTDRIEPTPPFTNVGVDAFGPWSVIYRRTRGGCSNSKRWAILFTCLTTRAIHIEIVEEMSSSAFINALRRFIAIRGKVSVFRSDRGTNFIGAVDPLHIEAINVEDDKVKTFMHETRTIWIFNPPHSSHMGGAWERLIGVTRRILDSILTDSNTKFLTHDVLVTFMAEVASIVNHRPIVPVSSDTDNPFILSPAVLLTQKTKSTIETDYIGEFDTKDLLRAEWKRVMVLSDMFWSRWRKEYLNNLQSRRKWHKDVPNIKEGDVVLLRDKTLIRNEWPLGLVIRAFASDDGKVRKTEIRVIRDGKPTVYVRPITELVLLVSDREQCV